MEPRNSLRDQRTLEHALSRLDLCRGVAPETLAELGRHARLLRLRRGAVLVRRGERPVGVFAVLRGAVKTRLQHANGDELILTLLRAGSTVGVAATVLDRPSKVDLVALEKSIVLLVDAATVSAKMACDARFVRNVANELATKAQVLVAQFQTTMLPTLQRLAAYLESIAEPTGAPQVWTARLPVSKTVVAARLGMKKETLSRLLQRLARQGVIEVARREITIRDRARLAATSSDGARPPLKA